ncbi:MAG: hypothetical protein II218_07565 [Peptococcaceae bacterium]|nr:hypothetical protein [Peptococcaceae bacterium]MBQ2035751.1 hypothetical protein [Peptococcaceae bacterium]
MYPPEEKTEIERVLAAFQPYIKTARNEYGQPACDVVWLERLQCYLYTTNYSRSEKVTDTDLNIFPVESAKGLYWDIMFDIVQKEYHRYNFQNMRLEQIEKELLKQAETEITIAVEPYLEALPEYRETGIEIIKEYTKIYRK